MNRFIRYTAILQIICMLFMSTCVQANQTDANFLTNVAKQYMLAQFPSEGYEKKYIVKTGKVDANRDYGGKCSGFLTAELVGSEIKKSNVVRITCSRKKNPFVVNIPVTVSILRLTTIAATNIPKGSVITADLLEDSYVNENTNLASAITDKNMILGSKARKDIRAGEQIRVSDFCLIAKGDVVTIEAKSHNLYIRTQGIALEEGKLNDQIQVRNSKSQKVIRAQVTAPGVVTVIF